MSFIKFNKTEDLPESTPTPAVKESRVSMRIDVVAIPTGSQVVSSKKRAAQAEAITQVKNAGKDLFFENNTVVSETGSNRLYQTADLYNAHLSLENLIPMLTDNDLTLRLNALRTGVNSHSTCMELTSGTLADIITKTNADAKGEKSTSVNLKTNKEAGTMWVGVRATKQGHFIHKLDYEVNSLKDDQLHID